ncbi:MAG: hypothetical protein CVV18_03025 [Gammaproteobacteria bacterium HGW-Gammaproteobacteria-8]|nr:MAG: hypothetical protein CVV18_03025 [Gammaproteobacteria bacterium HGW-Gammaproteobacteria-8]
MILDGKLVHLASWSDLIDRADFAGRLDESIYSPLKEIVGIYTLKEKHQCGRSECGKWHYNGYVVIAASDQLINIGKDCGTNFFDVDFHEMARNFNSRIDHMTRQRRLQEFKELYVTYSERVALIRGKVDALRGGIKALKLINDQVPRPIIQILRKMIQARDPMIRKARRLTKEERDAQAAMSKGAIHEQYIEEDIKVVRGFSALFPENDFKQVVFKQLQQPLEEFTHLLHKIRRFSGYAARSSAVRICNNSSCVA